MKKIINMSHKMSVIRENTGIFKEKSENKVDKDEALKWEMI